jgi:hypothetical protein
VSPWSSVRLEGVPAGSGVAVWRDHLIVSSAAESRLHAVPRSALRDGAVIRAKPIALSVDGERETRLRDESGPRPFRLKHLWEGPQRISGLAISDDGVLYASSEAYRVVWFGPFGAGRAPGAPSGAAEEVPDACVFHRAAEVTGARRTRRGESDWQDYGDETATNGISGVAVVGPDLLVIERGRGLASPSAYRVDRMAGTTVEGFRLSYVGEDDSPGARGWTDLAPSPAGFFGLIARDEAEIAVGRILEVPAPRLAQQREGAHARGMLALPDAPKGRMFEGMAVTSDAVFAVRPDGGDASVLVWRTAR